MKFLEESRGGRGGGDRFFFCLVHYILASPGDLENNIALDSSNTKRNSNIRTACDEVEVEVIL